MAVSPGDHLFVGVKDGDANYVKPEERVRIGFVLGVEPVGHRRQRA